MAKDSSKAASKANDTTAAVASPHVPPHPAASLYAQGDAKAACREARAVLADKGASPEAQASAKSFLDAVATDRMTKATIAVSALVVLAIILAVYVFR